MILSSRPSTALESTTPVPSRATTTSTTTTSSSTTTTCPHKVCTLINHDAMTVLWETGDPHETLPQLLRGYAHYCAAAAATAAAAPAQPQGLEANHQQEEQPVTYRLSTLELGDVLGPQSPSSTRTTVAQQAQQAGPSSPFFFFRHVLLLETCNDEGEGEGEDEEGGEEEEEFLDFQSEEDDDNDEMTITTATTADALNLAGVVLAYNIGMLLHSMAFFLSPHQQHQPQHQPLQASTDALRLTHDARAWYQTALMAWSRCHPYNYNHGAVSSGPRPEPQQLLPHDILIPQALFTNLGHVASLLQDSWCMAFCQGQLQQQQQQQQRAHNMETFHLSLYEQRQRQQSERHWQVLTSTTSYAVGESLPPPTHSNHASGGGGGSFHIPGTIKLLLLLSSSCHDVQNSFAPAA